MFLSKKKGGGFGPFFFFNSRSVKNYRIVLNWGMGYPNLNVFEKS